MKNIKDLFSWLTQETFDLRQFFSIVFSFMLLGVGLFALVGSGVAYLKTLLEITYGSGEAQGGYDFFFFVILFALAAISIYLGNKEVDSRSSQGAANVSGNLDQRLMQLTDALKESGNIISVIETEIEDRKDLVDKLEKDRKIAEDAISMNREQVDAVTSLLTKEINIMNRKADRRGLRREIGFFLAGVFVTALLGYFGIV